MSGGEFTLEDFQAQLKTLRKMGPLEQVLGMIPGLGNMKNLGGAQPDEREMNRVEAIVSAMTPGERRNYKVIDGSRRGASRAAAAPAWRRQPPAEAVHADAEDDEGDGGMAGGGHRARMRQAMAMMKGRGLRA